MNVLVTGVTGTGKTTLCKELKRSGYACTDDSTGRNGFGAWYNPDGNRIPHLGIGINFARKNLGWGWDIKKLEDFLATNDRAIVCGFTRGITGFASKYFDHIILLAATPELINARLNRRPFGYGFRAKERRQVLEDLRALPVEISDFNPQVIDADQPVGRIAELVIDSIVSGNDN